MVLYPEKGIELSGTAAEIMKLCTGELSVEAIVDSLTTKYGASDRAVMEREVLDFLNAMADRCLIEDTPS